MKWHETHRARTAARTLANYRKAKARELIRSTAHDMALRLGMAEQAERLR